MGACNAHKEGRVLIRINHDEQMQKDLDHKVSARAAILEYFLSQNRTHISSEFGKS